MYPRQSATTHTEQLGAEASVYDWARAQVHALNPTAACVWRRCDGATSRDAITAAVHRELGLSEAGAVVDLTLTQLARLHLLEEPVASSGEGPAPTRRWLLAQGVAAALLPAIYSVVAPTPLEAQSPGPGVPTLTGIEPDNGNPRSTVAVELRGTNFVDGGRTIVNVSGSGVTAADVVVASATSMTATLVIEAGAAEGPRTVTVTTAGGTSGGQTFRVTLPTSAPGAPALTSLSPNQGVRGATVAVTLTGTGFVAGATTVGIAGGSVGIHSVVVNSATSLTASFVLDAAATAGPRAVTVTTPGGTSGAQTFSINALAPGAPTLTSVTPNLGLQGRTVAVTLTGNNFKVGATTVAVAGGGVAVNSIVVASATSLTANFVLDPAAAEGAHAVTVTTVDGTSGAQTFTVAVPLPPGAPTLTSVAPNQGARGTTVAVMLTGTEFIAGATTVAVGGGGVTVANVVVSSETALTANFALDPAAALGPRTVTVTTPVGTSAPQIFTVAAGAPTLASITPNQGVQGTTVAVTLTGANFVVGATTVAVAGGGMTVNNVVVSSDASLTASFVLDPAATGPRSVTVTTAAGTSGGQTFTITLPPAPGVPTLTTVTPNQGLRGTTVAVTLTGTNFVVGATTVNVGAGMTVNTVVVANATSLTANVVLDPAAVAGPRTVTVTTASGTSGPQAFTLTLPPPTLTSLSPSQAIRGEAVTVTLTGTNFVVGGTTVGVAGGGITVNNVVVGNATSLTASFLLDLAAGGPRMVTVTTAAGTSGPQTFEINLPVPGVASFGFTGGPVLFTVPAGVSSILIEAVGAKGGLGISGGTPGDAGRAVARVSITPGRVLTVRVGGTGQAGAVGVNAIGGFNGGGSSTGGGGGGGGGGTSVRDGQFPLVIAGGGGGGGVGTVGGGGRGGTGGGLIAGDAPVVLTGGGPGRGGGQVTGGSGGAASGSPTATDGTAGLPGAGGTGGSDQPGVLGGGGGGGGYFGGGGGGGGNPGTGGGGGGSSFTAPGATEVLHQQGSSFGNSVLISW